MKKYKEIFYKEQERRRVEDEKLQQELDKELEPFLSSFRKVNKWKEELEN